MTYKYVVPDIPQSLNRFAGRGNLHEYRKQKQVWKELVYAYTLGRECPAAPLKKAVVEITYFFGDKKRRDPDNYAGKMILDGLTLAKIIADDTFDTIDLVLCGEYDKENPRTEIIVTEGYR